MAKTDEDLLLEEISLALDEIYQLRAWAAVEARVIEEHLELKTFPKSRIPEAQASIDRLRALARGEYRSLYSDERRKTQKPELTASGAKQTLVRGSWVQQQIDLDENFRKEEK